MQTAQRNSRLAVAITGLGSASFILPIWVLFLNRQIGLSIGLAIFLGISRWASSAFFELPTGSWADRFGRVKIYRFGQFFFALTYLPFLLTKNFPILLATQILGGFFAAMTTGTLQPLVHDSYKKAKANTKYFKHYLSNNSVSIYLFRFIAGVAGAWIYSKHAYTPYALEVIVLLIAFIMSLRLKEVRIEKSTASNNMQHISEALNYVKKHTYLRNFFIVVIIFTFFSEAVWTSLQPLFDFRGIDPKYFGVLFGAVAIFSAMGSYLSRRIPDSFDGLKVRVIMSVTVIIAIIFMQFSFIWAIVLAVVIMGVSFGFSSPNSNSVIQKHVESKYQSTVLSLKSLLDMMFYSTTSFLVGFWADLYGVGTLVKILLVQAVVGTLFIIFVTKITLKEKHV